VNEVINGILCQDMIQWAIAS